jgi:two-component system nitrogen regulation sensor histidine kinase NtrY
LTTSAQIRLLLTVVCITFLLTAVIVKETFTPKVNLAQTAVILQSNLNDKEAYVNKFMGDKHSVLKLQQAATNSPVALDVIKDLTTDHRIWVYTYYNNHLNFWSGVKILPENPLIYKEGASFVKLDNGYYQVIKKTIGNFSVLFSIPVKSTYHFQNRYLLNTFDKDLLTDNNLAVADFTDKAVVDIHTVNNSYLFSVKLKPGNINHRFYYFEVILWLLGFITLCTLVHNICSYVAGRGYAMLSFGLLAAFILAIRFINLNYAWPDLSSFEIFNARIYASSRFFPSLGDFCINILALTWLASFIYYQRFKIIKNVPGKAASYAIIITGNILIVVLATFLLQLFNGLVVNSKISFDVTNVFNLSGFSLLGVLMLCFSFLLFYLLNDAFLMITRRLDIPDNHKAGIFILFMVGATGITFLNGSPSAFYILAGAFTAIRAFNVWYGSGKLNGAAFLGLVAICSLIAAIKLNYFQQVKEAEIRMALVQKLEVADDLTADQTFPKIEQAIITDPYLANYFTDNNRNDDYLKNRLQKQYFDSYLSKYDLKVYAFTKNGDPITGDKNYLLNDFKDLVTYSSFKVSKYFYHANDFGFQSYFAIIPIINNDVENLGTIVVALSSKPLFTSNTFPELLVDGEIKSNAEFKDYSYAFYTDGHLLSQNGKYAYNLLINPDFKGTAKGYIVKKTASPSTKWYKPLARYSHLIYHKDKRNTIVVSHEEDPIAQGVTSLTFFFVTLLAFSALVVFITWLWTRIRIFNIRNKRLKWGFKINVDKVLYRSRIQFSVIFTVVITLLLIGIITFTSISNQYRDQQDEMIREKINRIGSVFEAGLQKELYASTQAGQVKFNEFADTYSADLTLYSYYGVPLLTTQPKIYDYNLLARRMNGRAYIAMNREQQSSFVNDERVGNLDYKAAYIPIKGAKGNTVAFLQLPYFANQSDYNDRIGALLNAMINVYALVFIAIGLFAVIIARQITSPLTFIQYNLSKTIYGQKNEPIVWDRDDEIGALVKEYNKMIAELENSAQRLAQSERETAWREMAKQVAHEIKNPLTPLKLGLQLLDKAWKDKDPKFDQKFERFSKSFVEQIESLSSIASEFSAFAKMPDTKLEKVNLFEIIGQAVIIFKQMDNVTINYHPGETFFIRADRDQLLRCFNNLLKNAIEAIPDERPGVISITNKVTADHVLVIVTDNGNGIPEQMRERIFAPNFTTKSSGTGLGLAFVKNSIENAGGKVWFETEIDKGTTFYMSLPQATI